MITLRQAVVVEGKYDKIRLSSLLDALILTTDGFRLFHDPEKRALIARLAHTAGIVILTDSDRAGQVIRAHIKSIARGGDVRNAYIPQIPGKEKRKSVPSKEGTLGVEGMDDAVLLEALKRAGVFAAARPRPFVTKADLMAQQLAGTPDSAARRRRLLALLRLPGFLSTNALLDLQGVAYTQQEFERAVALLKKGEE